jgi:hypothetical protein
MLYPAELRARKHSILAYSPVRHPAMFRSPFVWEIQVRRELLEDAIGELQELPHSIWRDLVGQPLIKTARARDGRLYRIRTTATWAAPGAEDIRVIVSLETTGLHRQLMRQSFVITPENTFAE